MNYLGRGHPVVFKVQY